MYVDICLGVGGVRALGGVWWEDSEVRAGLALGRRSFFFSFFFLFSSFLLFFSCSAPWA